MSDSFSTMHEIIVAARNNLPRSIWNYVTGAAETETTLRRNRLCLDSLALRPRILRDVREIDTETTFMGHTLRIPCLLAPIGSLQTVTPEGGIAVAKAAAEFGTMNLVSTVTEPALEEIAASTNHPKIFQIYVRGDYDWMDSLIDRARDAGYAALCLTVDSAYYGRRERQLITGWRPPSIQRYGDEARKNQAGLTWEWMERMRERGGLPFILKGVQTAEDAEIALSHGVDVIYVSNHGGRQLDHGDGTIEILKEVVAVVGNQAEIVVDGGFVRGTDVLKALAIGATAVALGRFQGWALAAGGQPALVRALEIMEAEIRNAMGLVGVASIDELDINFVKEAGAVGESHELSAFPFLPEEIRGQT
ncbi:MAG: alpha-hydroxy acid oxidase [Pseudomonadota bacterium]|nr:alpha-hydroxy acid oxidase [Pseudomonadota bacterium]